MAEGELQKLVGANLRQRRVDQGLSQEAFAELLGWHRTYIGGLERGERNLSLRALERIAGRLGIDPSELLKSP
jgi:transcriptional regulator with XRE-family HTH domain